MPGGSDDVADLDPDGLARAKAALSRLSDDYLSWAASDCGALSSCLAEIAADPSDPADGLWRLFRIAHDMKGQAGTFGYPLVTEIARRLCLTIEAMPEPDGDGLARLSRHVEALAEIVAGRLDGDGGDRGRELLDGLG